MLGLTDLVGFGARVAAVASATVNITALDVTSNGHATSTARSGIRVRSTGSLERRNGASYTAISGQWLTSGNAADVQVQFTVTDTDSNGSQTGTTGSYLDCSSDQEFFCNGTIGSAWISYRQVLIEFRDKNTLVPLGSATWTLNTDTDL